MSQPQKSSNMEVQGSQISGMLYDPKTGKISATSAYIQMQDKTSAGTQPQFLISPKIDSQIEIDPQEMRN